MSPQGLVGDQSKRKPRWAPGCISAVAGRWRGPSGDSGFLSGHWAALEAGRVPQSARVRFGTGDLLSSFEFDEEFARSCRHDPIALASTYPAILADDLSIFRLIVVFKGFLEIAWIFGNPGPQAAAQVLLTALLGC